MPTIDKISIELEARTQNYQAQLKQAQALTRLSYTDMSRRADQLQKSVNASLGKINLGKINPSQINLNKLNETGNKSALSLSPQQLGAMAMMAPNLAKDQSGEDAAIRERKAVEELIATLSKEQEMAAAEQANISALADQTMQYRAVLDESVLALGQNEHALAALKGAATDATGTLLSGMKKGKTATDALNDAVKKLMQNLLQSGLNTLLGGIPGFSKGGLGGIFSTLFGSLFGGFAEGGYTGTGGKYQPAGIVHKGEVVWSQADIRRWGGAHYVDAMRRGYANGGIVGGGIVGRSIVGGNMAGSFTAPSVPAAPSSLPPNAGSTETIRVVLQDDSGRMATIADQRIQTRSGAIIEVAVKQSMNNVKRNINTIAQEGQTRYG